MAITKINLNDHLNPNHKGFFQSTDRRILFYGAKGSGKSYGVADKILLQPQIQTEIAKKDIKLKIVVIRQSLPSLKRSCIELFEERSNLFKMPYHLNKSDFIAEYGNGSRILYIGLDDSKAYQKLQSITNVDMVWIEELPEISEITYENADLILRGGQGLYKQFIGTFNPVSIGSWVYRRWWEQDNEKVLKIKTLAEDNPWIDEQYLETLKNLEFSNKSLYTVYYKGEWGILKGVIYDNYDIVDQLPESYEEIIYGLDFGFNNQTALLKIYLKDQECWLEQLIYKSGLTNNDLIREIKKLEINKNDPIYCDSAEPARIEEIHREGFNAKESDKNVKDGIDFTKTLKLHYLKSSNDLIKESAGYVWKVDKDGKPMDEPVKFQDHLMSAKRYALYTHLKRYTEARIRTI
jgi:phage terminase large subunit